MNENDIELLRKHEQNMELLRKYELDVNAQIGEDTVKIIDQMFALKEACDAQLSSLRDQVIKQTNLQQRKALFNHKVFGLDVCADVERKKYINEIVAGSCPSHADVEAMVKEVTGLKDDQEDLLYEYIIRNYLVM